MTASFNAPSGICIDRTGNIYVAGFGGQNIRMITSEGIVTTIAGTGEMGYADGAADRATFSSPRGICIDSKENLFVGDCRIIVSVKSIKTAWYRLWQVLDKKGFPMECLANHY
jgi:hypothetical protein